MINYALPGTIVGIAYLIAFNDPPIELTGTALIIIACYVFRYGPTGIRATVALLQQIDKSLEEASQGLGRRQRHDVSPRHAAADPAGVLRRARRRVHPLDDGDQRDDLPGVDRLDADHGEDPGEHHRACRSGPAAAFSVLVVVIVFVVIAADRPRAAPVPRAGRDAGDEPARRMTR